jgi:hypothetical protein
MALFFLLIASMWKCVDDGNFLGHIFNYAIPHWVLGALAVCAGCRIMNTQLKDNHNHQNASST